MTLDLSPTVDLAIVGGSAAGLATAIFAARARPSARVAVLDGAASLGAKILISGGGRCNVTNREVVAADFNGGDRRVVTHVLRAFPVSATVGFFEELGVPLHEERRGKLFPDSNKARTVLDALLRECVARNVTIHTSTRVNAVVSTPDGFVLETSQPPLRARYAVLATGGRSLPRTGSDGHGYDLARSLGHSIVPTTPALVPLLLDGDVHDGLAGVAHEVRATVTAGRDRRGFDGPMLWTHVGVSGPAILDASRHWLRHALEGTGARVSIQSTPGEFADLERWIIDAARTNPRATAPSLLSQRLPAAIAERVSRTAGADSVPLASLDWPRRRALVHALTDLPLPVRDSRGYDHAEATAGGVALTEVDAATMASRTCPGLFLIGEMLDVDGRLGGFNFQWAWSSAYVAGTAVARAI